MSEDELSKIIRYLGLDRIDGRLKLKADSMIKTIELTQKWKRGSKQEWVDKLANRTCISTRKIRENYLEPLITEGILRQLGNDNIEFVGLPDGAEMPQESSEEQLRQEYTEYIEKKKETELYLAYKKEKPKTSFEKWVEAKAEQEGFKPQQESKKPLWQAWIENKAQQEPEINFETWKRLKKPNEA
jgi:hypothetical protein